MAADGNYFASQSANFLSISKKKGEGSRVLDLSESKAKHRQSVPRQGLDEQEGLHNYTLAPGRPTTNS